MSFVEIDQLKIYYEVQGEGEALFLLHDLFEDHLHWHRIQEELSKYFKVISLDFRGSGRSSLNGAFRLEDLAKDVIQVAKELKIEKFHLLGDSYGGCVAQIIAAQFPDQVDKLILTNSFLKLSSASEWFLEMIEDLFKSGQPYLEIYKLILPWFFSSWFLEFEEDIQKILYEIEKRKHPLKAKGYTAQLKALKEFEGTKFLKKITAKTLLIIGEDDIFTLFKESRALLSKIKNHQVELCPGGHKTKFESPTRFLELVLCFLKTN